jgi:hypothetical protein
MIESGTRPRPARILVVASGAHADRVIALLLVEGHAIEATDSAIAATKRLAAQPPIELALIDGVPDLDRVLVIEAARLVDVWCAYLRMSPAEPELSPEERSDFVATIDCSAPDARIASAISSLVRAQRQCAAAARGGAG